MITIEPHVIGTMSDGTQVVEIICPACSCTLVDSLDDQIWECGRCGIHWTYTKNVDPL